MNQKLIRALSFQDYLANPGYGSSDLRAFRFGPPAMVPWGREHRDDTTDATKLGAAAHCAILTPDLFDSTYVAKPPGMTFASNVGKAWREEKLAAGYLVENILSDSDATAVAQVRDAFHQKGLASQSLHRATNVECSLFWSAQCGLPLKARPDWYDSEAVYDLKVSVEAAKSLDVLRYRAYANGWLGQLAQGRDGLRANGGKQRVGRLVVIAPKPPQHLHVWLLEVAEHDLDILALENENTARDMLPCHESGNWPGSPEDWQKCPLPADHLMADLEGAETVEEEQ